MAMLYLDVACTHVSASHRGAPAVTVGRMLSDTFAGIDPASAPAFIAFQLVGGGLAVALARYLYPDLPALDIVVPHDHASTADPV